MKTVNGDAFVNTRKGKRIVSYDLEVTLGADVAAGTAGSKGGSFQLRIPSPSEENKVWRGRCRAGEAARRRGRVADVSAPTAGCDGAECGD